MFILRKTGSDNSQINNSLGSFYILVESESSKELFKSTLKKLGIDNSDGKIYALISCKDGQKTHYLYKGINYYIMTESGNTFANVSLK